jgi:hypothetical protein
MHYIICTNNSTVLNRVHIFVFLGLPAFLSSIKVIVPTLIACHAFQQAPKKIKESSGSKKALTYYIEFEMGKSNLNLSVKEKLDRIYTVYVSNSTDTVNILTETAADKLYKERSIHLTNYLISKGVPASHIRAIDFGKKTSIDGIDLIIK